MHRILTYILTTFLVLITFCPAQAQIADRRSRVDTLSILDRISVRTNAVDWLLLTPNVGVEFDIRNTNWNRWSALLNVRYNWNTSHTYTPGVVYNLFDVSLEGREYWRTRKVEKPYFPRHKHFYQRILSTRRMHPKYEGSSMVFYRGGYAAYSKFSNLFGSTGYQGSAISAGFSYGIIKPIAQYATGNSLDIEFGIKAGLLMTNCDEYRHDRESNCYPRTKRADGWKICPFPMVHDISVSLVYRLGKYLTHNKYRYRYDVDEAFQLKYRNRADSIEKARNAKHFADSMYKVVNKRFFEIYDSIAKEHRQSKSDSLNNREYQLIENPAPPTVKGKAAAKAAKAEAKAAKKAAKAAAKAGLKPEDQPAVSAETSPSTDSADTPADPPAAAPAAAPADTPSDTPAETPAEPPADTPEEGGADE